MIKPLLSRLILVLCLSMMLMTVNLNAQQTVFTETFNTPGTPQSPNFTTTGPIGTSKWAVTRSGGDLGAKIDGGMLTLTNDVTSAGNSPGWVMASTSTSNYNSLYKSILSQNVGVVSWTFNMRQNRPNPSGFNSSRYGVAFILAGTPGTTNSTGKGYAIVLGQNTDKDPIRLATYSNGLSSIIPKLTSKTPGLSDFGAEYTSVRVEYNPAGNIWSLYVRKDNSTSFQDPQTGTLVFQEQLAIADFVNESLAISGAFWNTAKNKNQTAFFDNISVSVETPSLISLDPDSKIANTGAFTLTVNGDGFLQTSKIKWNGADRPTSYVSATKLTAAIPAADLALANIVPITVTNGTFTSNGLPFTIETAGNPVLTLSATSLPAISMVAGAASTVTNTYTISGVNLIEDAIINAPANFEISRDGTTYADQLILPDNVGTGALTGQPITLRARIKANTPAGNYTGNISHTSPNALTKLVAVSGRVYAAEPTVNASSVAISNITSTGFKLDWSNGNGAQRLVLIKEAAAVSTLPLDGITYNANAAFGTGSQIGTGNFVVYKGTGTSVQITGLQPITAYYISIVEFNGLPSTENYRSEGATENTTTLNSPVGLQVKLANASYKINFDDTVDGVNLDTFQGIGMSKIVESGQLDSNSWAFSGFSGGNIAFAGNSVEDSSYENGPSDGEEDDTGIYAFNVGTSDNPNYTLGIQPGGTGTSADFNPGSITLRIQNQTGAAMTSVNVGYKVYVYNDQAASSRIRFSYGSSATGTYADQIIADVVSPATADLAPGWKAYYRVVTIPTGNIPNNSYYYIRWTGSLVSGTGAQDEFAIDDIEVIANPTTNTVAFNGIAEDFVLQGNASLSNDLSVQNRLLFNGGKLAIKDKTLTIAGIVTNTTANGLSGGAGSRLVVRGIQNPTLSFDQTTLGTSNLLNSFSLDGANPNTVTISNAFSVSQLLAVDEQQILNLGTIPLLGTLNFIQNNGIIQTQNTSALPFTSGKTWAGSGILNMNASTTQTLVAGTYTNLTLSSTGGTVATGNSMVNGILNLPAANASATMGSLSMSTFTLTMGPDGTNTGIGDVTGIIKRDFFTTNKTYTFGHPNSSITFPPAGTLPTSMSAKLTIGAAPSWRAGAIQRQFDIIQTGGISTKAIIRQHYLDSELNGNTEIKLVFWGHKVTGSVDFEQGKSSNNSVDNWVEISNANVAQYFENQFGKVYITLDDTQGIDHIVWNGSVSDSWTTIENWTPNVKPGVETKVIIPNTSTTNFDPTLNPSETIGSIVIETGGIVNSTNTSQLFLAAGSGAWQNYGTFNPGSGTSSITFNNLDATISGSTTFNNINIPVGAGIRPSEGNYMSIAGALTNNGTMFTTLIPNTIEFKGTNQIIPAPGGEAFGGYHNLIVTGSGATIAPAISTLNVRGNLTINQPISFAGKTVNLAGLSDQTISGTAAINFYDLIVNKETGAVILAKDIMVGGTLTLTKGNVVLGTNNLTLGSNAVAGTFGTNTMIVADGIGVVRRSFAGIGSYLFPIGELDGAPSYAPITVNVTAGTFNNAFVGVNVTHAKHPNNNSSQNYLKKYWNVTQTGISNAVATITANYDALDILGSESEIAAAQLNGTFNVTTNPWIKFGPLSNNTLVATNATLTNGQTSVFTGIKAAAFGLEVYGYGDFCVGSEHTMNAVISGGDAPFTYVWSNGLENAGVVTIPTATVGEIHYTLTVYDANGFSATDINIPVYVFPLSVGGTIANASQQICANSLSVDLELTGSVGTVLHWQKSTDINFETFENISNFTTTLTGAQIGSISATTYIRAVLQNGDCDESVSSIATITIANTTWNGISWSNGEPNISISATFDANYTATANIEACSMTVSSGANVSIPFGFNVTVNGALTVDNGGLFTLENNANLIQNGSTNTNSGSIIVQRNSSLLKRLDYTIWSSPTFGAQSLQDFGVGTLPNRFYTYTTNTNQYLAVPSPSSTNFATGKGYLIRMPDTHSTTGAIWNGVFTGKPNSGDIIFAMNNFDEGQRFNAVGNPYPSPIDATKFVTDNIAKIKGTLYFWRKTNNALSPSYSTWTTGGFVTNNEAQNVDPNGIIQTGQGFIVEALGTATELVFNNAMRSATNADQFFKTTNAIEFNRVWLNATSAEGLFSQTLISYFTNGSDALDSSDGKYLNDGDIALTSVIENVPYAIQGKGLPFNSADTVAMQFKAKNAGTYTIAIDHVDGLFEGNQDIFLRDTQTGIEHDLKSGGYTFASEAGTFAERFLVIYQNPLSVKNPAFDSNSVVLYKKENNVVINSGRATLDYVEVYDVRGRLLAVAKKINSNEVSINVGETNQVLIVKITSADGITITKKTIN